MITQIKEYALIKLSCVTAVIAEVGVLQEERKKFRQKFSSSTWMKQNDFFHESTSAQSVENNHLHHLYKYTKTAFMLTY